MTGVVVDRCPTEGCGNSADDMDATDPRLTGWVIAAVLGSAEPPRFYCCGRCSARGIALMGLRVKAKEAA